MGTGYRLGKWTVRPHRNRIECGSETVQLGPKAMAVLDCLAKASNSVVNRREIFDFVWPGAVVSDDALTQRIVELRKAFGDASRQSKIIETIPKIGFRLIPPVIPLAEESEAGSVIPSIAVLPLVNMSEDPSNEYLSDGISEELINLLAKVPGLEVRSRSTSFSFKGERIKMADLARELNASLIVEGTVRKIGNHVRITAQLIDTTNDKHLCSESFDHELSELFVLQEEIAQSIVTAMQDVIGTHRVRVERPTENVEAYELFLLGRHRFYQRGPAMDSAIRALQMAVEKDPDFAEAWAYLAAAASVTWAYQTSTRNEDARLIAEQASSRSLELNPEFGLALAAQAILAYGYDGDLKRGFHLIDRALDQDPHDTTIRLWAGIYCYCWGYLKESLTHFRYALRHDPQVGVSNGMLGTIYLAQGREQLAASRFNKATELGWPHHYLVQASLYMMRGDVDAAIALLKFTLTDPGTDIDPLPWIYEIEKAGRYYLENPESSDLLISVVEGAPRLGIIEKTCLTLLFNLKDQFFEYFSRSIKESHLWPTFVMSILWLPEYKAYVEDPRFFEIMRRDGAVELWEQRGFPDGCSRVDDATGDRLDCSKRYQSSPNT